MLGNEERRQSAALLGQELGLSTAGNLYDLLDTTPRSIANSTRQPDWGTLKSRVLNESFPEEWGSADRPNTAGLSHTSEPLPQRHVKAEVNLLRLPLFALNTANLRQLDGFECRGSVTRNGHTQQYTWRVTRHATRPFPGPLARAAHLAFLHIVTERGLPFQNPITWRWRDLCRRIGIAYSGRTVRRLKEAVRATHGVILEGRGAVYSKTGGQWLSLEDDDRHLYARLRFSRRRKADGEEIEQNGLWLADWYLDSLNALYTAPLDHQLWRWLDRRSPIASRLYEYLLPSFYGPAPALSITYPNLAQALPVRVERYLSDARRQLGPAFAFLSETRVLDRAEWTKRQQGLALVKLYRGDRLSSRTGASLIAPSVSGPIANEPFEVRELRRPKIVEEQLVADFYRLWQGSVVRPATERELETARKIVNDYGPAKGKALIPLVIRELKQHWPDAKMFGAVAAYLPQANDRFERELKRRRERAAERQEQSQQEQLLAQGRQQRQQIQAQWQPLWDALSRFEQDEIRATVLAGRGWLRHLPSMLADECLAELAKRRSAAKEPSQGADSGIANGAQLAR